MRRFRHEVAFCLVIVLYCLLAGFLSLRPQLLEAQTSAKPGNVKSAVSVRFAVQPDAPDPNKLLDLVNKIRVENRIRPLAANAELGQLAFKHAYDMTSQQYYDHRDPDGRYYYDYFKNYGLNPSYSCENLDLLFVADNNQTVQDWLNSPKGHRECLLNPATTDAGYAITTFTKLDVHGASEPAYVVVAIFTQ